MISCYDIIFFHVHFFVYMEVKYILFFMAREGGLALLEKSVGGREEEARNARAC